MTQQAQALMFRADLLLRLGEIMERFRADVLVATSAMFGKAGYAGFGDPEVFAAVDASPIIPSLREGLPRTLKHLEKECVALNLRASRATIGKLLNVLSDPNSHFAELRGFATELYGRLTDELQHTICLTVGGNEERLFTEANLFGEEVAAAFPSAGFDIEEAGKCLALGRGTSCVFHLMRVLEVGLQALARDLGIGQLDSNWQKLIEQVESAIRALPFKSDAEKGYRSSRSEAAAHLMHVKNAWRNDVMHPRDSYTPEQALDVFSHSKALMATLAGIL